MAVLVAIAGFLVVASVVYLWRSPGQAPQTGEESSARTPSPSGENANRTMASGSHQTASESSDPLQAGIDRLIARLQSGQASDADVEALRQELLNADPQQATAAIRAFLDSGRDIETRQEFMIGEGGVLAGAPTMRTLLLDVLGQISRKTRSSAAAEVSRSILEKKDSPDEWAVAMRNVGWHDPKSKPYLAGKFREMLTHEPWTTQPSAGFLESFDVAVFSGDPALVPDLSNILSGENEELRRAAAVALDRLSAMAPLQVMSHLNANPTELADRPFLRADYYAKTDLSNPAQRQALETYLARNDVSLPEKTKLLKALATPASFVSDNLLTSTPSAPVDDSPFRTQQLSQTLDQWLQQNRFPELQGEMGQLRQRVGK